MGGGKGGGGGGSAPDPDPRIGEAALKNADLGRYWLKFAKSEASDAKSRQKVLDNLTEQIGQQQLSSSKKAMSWAAKDRQTARNRERKYNRWSDHDRKSSLRDRNWALRERDTARKRETQDRREVNKQRAANRPIEKRMRKDAMEWDSKGRLSAASAEARADVMTNAAIAKAQSEREMASMGIRPDSGRFQGINRATNQNTALAAAGSQNRARDNRRTQAVSMRDNAARYGLGAQSTAAQIQGQNTQSKMSAAGFGAGQYNAALGAAGLGAARSNAASAVGNQGINTSVAAGNSVLAGQAGANAMATQPMSIMGQGFGGAMQGNTSMMNGLNTQYGNELQAWSTNRQAAAQESAGLWGGLGSAAGTAAGFMMMSSKDAKTDKAPVEGSALEAVKGLPVESWRYKEGIEDGGASEHIGPYAEDFQAATGKGDGKQIPLQDMMGLQLKAIQELGIKVDQLEGKGRRKTQHREMAA